MLNLTTASMDSGTGDVRYKWNRSKVEGGAGPGQTLFVNLYAELTPVGGGSAELRKEFEKQEKKWKNETRHISSPTEKYLHPSYARIIGLGQSAVPLILHSLEREADDWFYALRAITGENPVTATMAGDVRRMADAWIVWGRQKGLLRWRRGRNISKSPRNFRSLRKKLIK